MGQEEAVPLPATVVVASWEPAAKPDAEEEEDRDMPPESQRKAKPPARRPSVPPPPGRAPGSTRSFLSRARSVRPEDDPFLAAYLACTRSGGGATSRPEPCRGRRRFTWAGLGIGLGLSSCKGSGAAAVEQSMVKLLANKRPGVDPS